MMHRYYFFFRNFELVRGTPYVAERSFSSESVNMQTVDKLIS
jgi:hypothetical protein